MIVIDRSNWNLARAFFSIISLSATIGICCNFLLFLTTGSFLAQLPMLFDFHIEMDSNICDVIMFLPGMGIAIGNGCILCIGVDRMFSVIFSTRYRSLNKLYYHSLVKMPTIPLVKTLKYAFITYQYVRRVLCEVLSPYPNGGVVLFAQSVLVINCVSSVVYFKTWLELRSHAEFFFCIKRKQSFTPDSTVMKRIVKSLFIIVTVDVSGWFITPGLFTVYETLNL
ncbi:hypothetical protein PENTCL1PPCAC_15869, partial [Pristionchus entomophagus]